MAKNASPVKKTVAKPAGEQKGRGRASHYSADLKRQLQIQKALYEIADAASAATDMQSFYKRLHKIVGTLMYAGNFFIATYDETQGMIQWDYVVDEKDRDKSLWSPKPLNEEKSGTAYCIRTGKELWTTREYDELVKQGELEMEATGAVSVDAIGIPLKSGQKVLGVLAIQSYTEDITYTEQDKDVLTYVAQHISTALTRARAIEAEHQRVEELARSNKIQKALYEIADAASASRDMQDFYSQVHRVVGELMYAENFFIAVYDEKSGLLSWPYFVDEMEEMPSARPLAEFHGMTSWMIRTGNTARHGKRDLSTELLAEGEIRFPDVGSLNEDGMGVPLKADGKTIGVVMVQSYTKGIQYTDEDEQVLEYVAQHIAIALTRARAIEETRQRNSELAIINSVQEGLASKLEMQGIYDLVGDKIGEIFDAQAIQLVSFDREKNLMNRNYLIEKGQRLYGDPLPISKVWAHFISTRRTFLINNAKDFIAQIDPEFAPPVGSTPKSVIAVPLMVNGELKGAIDLENLDRENAFSESDARLLETLANSMSVALENARLFGEVQKRNQEITEALEQQTATSEILRVIASSPTDVQPVFDAIIERATVLCGGATGIAYQVMGDQIYVAAQYLFNSQAIQEVLADSPTPLNAPENESNIASVIRNRAILHVEDMKSDPRLTQWNRDMAVKYGAGSTLWIPLVKDETGIGAIFIGKYKTEPFTEQQIALVKTFADQAVIAIENVRLFTEIQRLLKETEQRAAELAVINGVQEGLASKLEMQSIYELVGDKLHKIFVRHGVQIRILDENTNMIYYPFAIDADNTRRFVEPSLVGETGFSYHVLRTRRPLLINEDAERRAAELGSDLIGFNVTRYASSMLFVPILNGERITGLIFLWDFDREHSFTDSDVKLVSTVASSMGVALENARLFNETQRLLKETEDRAAELAIINSVQAGLASKLDMQSIYDLVGDKIMEIFKADVVGIGFYDHASEALDYPYVVDHGERFFPPPMPIPDEMVDYLKTHDATLINTYQEAQAWMERFGIHNIGGPTPDNSYIVVPLTIGGEFMGRITVAKLPAYAFTPSDVRLLQTLVNSMSIALENARLWEQEKLYRKALQRELEIGREIQAGFLPEALPQIEGWEIAASLMSAREVAGDFYDAFELPDGNIGLVIADVCDKGVGAALFMTLFRSLIRAASNLDYFEHVANKDAIHTPTERLQRAMSLTNNYIAETHEKSGMFATLFFGILDPRDGRLDYINGGHEPPLIIRDGTVWKSLDKTGPAVGLNADGCFEVRKTTLHPDEVFLAFTDGVTDCQSPCGEFYGRDNLLNVLRNSSASSIELVKTIEADLRHYAADTTQFDDITLLAVKRVL